MFASGVTTPQQVVVSILDDVLIEGDEDFGIVLSNPSLIVDLALSAWVVTITDDDVEP